MTPVLIPVSQRKYVAYYRSSTEKSSSKDKKGKDKLTFKAQKTIVKHFYNGNIIKEFTEIKSAKNIYERPVLTEAIEYCIENNCYLLVAKVDRLSRNTEDGLYVFNKLKGKLTCCDIPVENLDKFTLTLFLAIADRDNEIRGINIRLALAETKKQGTVLGTPGNLTLEHRQKAAQQAKLNSLNNEEHQKALGLITTLKEQGLSFQVITDRLNKSKHKTSTGGKWSVSSAHALYKRSLSIVVV
jgi:DNA invertase Pin-like site-specific DNA recombinase